MLPANTTPLDLPYIVPQIYCTGPSPSKFKLMLGKFTKLSDIFHKEFSKIPSWTLPGIAGISFFIFRTSVTILQKNQTERMKQSKAFCIAFIAFQIIQGGVSITGLTSIYLGACRLVLRYCDHNKPSDAEYQLYLENLVTLTKGNVDNVLRLIDATVQENESDNPILQAGIDLFFQKFLERFSQSLDYASFFQLIRDRRIPRSTKDAIYKKLADSIKTTDPIKAICLIDAIPFYGLDNNLKNENKAQIFKQYAEDELARLPNHLQLLTNLNDVGLYKDVSQIIISYTDEDIGKRLYKITRYIEKTLYRKDNTMVTRMFFSLIAKLDSSITVCKAEIVPHKLQKRFSPQISWKLSHNDSSWEFCASPLDEQPDSR